MHRKRFDGLKPCAHCGGQPVVLIVPHGGHGLTAVRIECSECRISTPEHVFGGRVSGYDKNAHSVSIRWCIGLQDARKACTEIWNRREDGSTV